MDIKFVKYLRGNVTFAGTIVELKGSIQYTRKRTFIEIISLKKHLSITTFMLKYIFSLKILSGSIQCLIQKMFFSSSRQVKQSLQFRSQSRIDG